MVAITRRLLTTTFAATGVALFGRGAFAADSVQFTLVLVKVTNDSTALIPPPSPSEPDALLMIDDAVAIRVLTSRMSKPPPLSSVAVLCEKVAPVRLTVLQNTSIPPPLNMAVLFDTVELVMLIVAPQPST